MQFLVNGKLYDFDGRITGIINGKNKSTLKMEGIYNLTDSTSRQILTFPLYTRIDLIDDNSETLFRGVIKESTPTEISNQYAVKPTKIQAYDYKDFLADGILISRTFKNANPRDVLDGVFESLSQVNTVSFQLDEHIYFGLDMVIDNGTIQDGTPYDILNELANRTNSRFGVRDNIIYFRSGAGMVDHPIQELTTITQEDVVIFDLPELVKVEFQDSSSFGYANSVIIRSINVISSQTFVEVFPIAQGQITFTMNANVGEIKEVGLFDSRDESWRQLFVRESRGTEEPYNQWYEIKYTQGNNLIDYNDNLPNLLNGQTLYVEYYTIGRGVSIQNNNDEIQRVMQVSGYGDGRITYIEQKDDITSQTDLDNYAISILDKMSTPRQDYLITTGIDLGGQVSDIIKINEEAYVLDSIQGDHHFVNQGKHVLSFEYLLTNTKNDNQQINYYDSRLVSDMETDSIIHEEVVNAQLTMEVGEWKESTEDFVRLPVVESPTYEITLLNQNDEIFHQETRPLELNQNYELEVTLNGEQLEGKVLK